MMPGVEKVYGLLAVLLPWEAMQAGFMQRAFLALLLLAPMCAAMGILVVNFRMAFFSDAISHSAFTGVALGVLFQVDPRLTLIGFGLLVGLAITRMKHHSELSMDTIIGVFFATAIALGIAIISAQKGLTRNLQSFLYGDILTISDGDILWAALLFLVVMGFAAFSYNRLLFVGLSEPMAHAYGVRVKAYEYLFAAVLSLVVLFGIRAVGILLVTALLVVPAAAARNVARNAGGVFWWTLGFALFSSVAGLFTSVQWDSATGATVILFAAACFFLTALYGSFARR